MSRNNARIAGFCFGDSFPRQGTTNKLISYRRMWWWRLGSDTLHVHVHSPIQIPNNIVRTHDVRQPLFSILLPHGLYVSTLPHIVREALPIAGGFFHASLHQGAFVLRQSLFQPRTRCGG